MAGMDMGSMPSASSTSGANATGMAGMDMGHMDMGGGCEMNMIWNWKTIDSCFLASGWHVKTRGQFAGTCIGVFCWVVFLVFFRKLRGAFDRYIVANAERRAQRLTGSDAGEDTAAGGAASGLPLRKNGTDGLRMNSDASVSTMDSIEEAKQLDRAGAPAHGAATGRAALLRLAHGDQTTSRSGAVSVRPSLFEQLLRALMFGFEYSIIWLLGLILMSFNGYVIISAFLGAAFGFFFLDWDRLEGQQRPEVAATPKCC